MRFFRADQAFFRTLAGPGSTSAAYALFLTMQDN
jgi:hypothetical protein